MNKPYDRSIVFWSDLKVHEKVFTSDYKIYYYKFIEKK